MSKKENVDWASIFEYCPESKTCLKWINDYRSGISGKPVRRVNNSHTGGVVARKQMCIHYDRWPYPAKDVLWEVVHGKIPDGYEVRYLDNDPLNFKLENLYLYKEKDRNHKYDSFLGDWLYYDVISPSFLRWKGKWKRGSNVSKDDLAGSLDSDGYWKLHGLGGNFKVHKIVWALHNNFQDQTGQMIDHIDRNRANNNIENLRLVHPDLNPRNITLQKNSVTGFNGVTFGEVMTRKGNLTSRYVATVVVNGIRYSRSFSPAKWGDEEAFRLAKEWRIKKIEELNELGYGYTEDHGMPRS